MAGKACIISSLRSRRRWFWLALPLAAAAAALLTLAFRLFPSSAPSAPDARLTEAARDLTAYDVTLKLIPDSREVSISETITYRNDTGAALEQLTLRTWLNAFRTEETSPAALEELYDDCYPSGFSPGYLTFHSVQWQGVRADCRFADEAGTVLRVDIPPLAPGGTGELELRCVAQIPLCRHRAGLSGEEWQLGGVIPQLPLYENGAWREDAYTPVGDPFLSPCANFTLHVFMPEGYRAACSAPLEKGEDGGWHGSILAARDVALCASPSFHRAAGRAGNVQVYAFAGTDQQARRALDDARKAVEAFTALYGDFPYPAYTVCSVGFPFGGMEYSGLAMIGESNFAEEKKDTLELTVAHETAHQWFYSLVGSDPVNAPWQDEALCQWAMLSYVRARYGRSGYETLKYYQVDAPMAENIPGSLTPGSPIGYFGNYADYSAVVYGRGAALLTALEEMLPGGVNGFLKAYAEAFAFRYASRQDFEAFLNRWSGLDCSPLLLDYLDTAH